MHDPLETARLDWRNATTPVSGAFGDVYFSADDGLAESRYNYIDNNFLPERFRSLAAPHFTIAETGFGTGLNFLLAWQCWREHAPMGKKLYYLSTECFPLHKADLEQSLACWPELAELAADLAANYPLPLSGVHTVELPDGVTLILLLGDATGSFQSLVENPFPLLQADTSRAIDAWFLDGFAPDKNPEMWKDELFQAIARLSRRGSTFASFTAAGIVRRGLKAVGFEVDKVKGFGRKREMIRGRFTGLPLLAEKLQADVRNTRFGPFWPVYRPQDAVNSVTIIGAGIAGCTTALLLAEAGLAVTLLDSHNEPFQGASGNPQAMLFPKVSHEGGAFADFQLLAYLYALRFYARHFPEALHNCGMVQLLNEKDLPAAEKTLQRFGGQSELVQWLDAGKASQLANTTMENPCLYFPGSGWLRPATLRDTITGNEGIQFAGGTTVTRLLKQASHWQVQTDTGATFSSDAVVLCNARAATFLLPTLNLPVKTIRGQVTQFPTAGFEPLRTIVCHEGYIAPPDPLHSKRFTCGASYELHSNERALLQSSQDYNLGELKKQLPDFAGLDENTLPLDGRVEFRCTSTDYLPLVGPVPAADEFREQYALYGSSKKAHIPHLHNGQEGLYINIAHGSRGFSSAPVCAALLRAYLCKQPWPMPFSMITALHPARFMVRNISRGK